MEGFKIKKNTTYELDLIHNYENIFRKYKKNNIRNIRKAIESKISIIKGLSPDEIFGLVQCELITSGSRLLTCGCVGARLRPITAIRTGLVPPVVRIAPQKAGI